MRAKKNVTLSHNISQKWPISMFLSLELHFKEEKKHLTIKFELGLTSFD